jgi:hypothetical protein
LCPARGFSASESVGTDSFCRPHFDSPAPVFGPTVLSSICAVRIVSTRARPAFFHNWSYLRFWYRICLILVVEASHMVLFVLISVFTVFLIV